MDEALRTDLLVNAVGAVGALAYLGALLGKRVRSTLENRSLLLVALVSTMLVLRGYLWLVQGHPTLGTLRIIPATLLPLAMTLFVEGVLRRHLPLAMKLLVLAITAALLALNLLGLVVDHPVFGPAFPIALISVLALLAGFVAFRDRAGLSAAENRFCGSLLLIATINVPLALTDFRTVTGFPPNRMGALGVLALCHLLADGGERLAPMLLARFLGLALLKSAAAIVALFAVIGLPPRDRLIHTLSIALALVLVWDLWERLSARSQENRQRQFLRWLAEDRSDDLPSFIRAFSASPGLGDHLIVGEPELRRYDLDALLARLRHIGHDCTLSRLRREVRRERGRGVEAAEQLVDLLERHQMTQVVLLGERPARLMLVNRPELADRDALLELRLISRRARSLDRRTADHG